MDSALSQDLIYQSVFDDEVFASIPYILKDKLQARSVIFHFVKSDGTYGDFANTGQWSQDQMQEYAKFYLHKDLLLKARTDKKNVNQVWNITEDLIDTKTFTNSAIYNEHYKKFGDDIKHALGVAYQTEWGNLAIGVHRGNSSKPFDSRSLNQLKSVADDIKRAIILRVGANNIRFDPNNILNITNNNDYIYFIIDKDLNIIDVNDESIEYIAKSKLFGINDSKLQIYSNYKENFLNSIDMYNADYNLKPRIVSILDLDNQVQRIKLYPFNHKQGRKILLAIKKKLNDEPTSISILIRSFGLTQKEAKVAYEVSKAKDLETIAQENNVSIYTIRSQLKSIFQKTKCNKQVSLAILINEILRP